jgi:hypothetical protein
MLDNTLLLLLNLQQSFIAIDLGQNTKVSLICTFLATKQWTFIPLGMKPG